MRRFISKVPERQKLYDFILSEYHKGTKGILINDKGYRLRGCTQKDEFWRGYDGYRCMGARFSSADICWRAGRDAARGLR